MDDLEQTAKERLDRTRKALSPSTPAVDHCVAMFAWPDDTFGLEKFGRNPEDMVASTPVAYHSRHEYSSDTEPLAAAPGPSLGSTQCLTHSEPATSDVALAMREGGTEPDGLVRVPKTRVRSVLVAVRYVVEHRGEAVEDCAGDLQVLV
jgi:hypothetical protein